MINDDPNPFLAAPSIGAIFNSIYLELGADQLRELLDGLLVGDFADDDGKPTILSRETLETAAEELAAIGLPEVAALVAEAAEKPIPERVLDCPYDETDRCNYESWQAAYQRRQTVPVNR